MPSTPKKPQDHKTKAKAKYGKGAWSSKLHDLEVPSGELCQVRRPGLQGLIKAGVLESMDSLTSLVQSETIPKAQGKPKVDAKKIMSDPKKMESMLSAIDKIVLHVVIQPPLRTTTVTQKMIDAEDSAFTQEDLDRELTDEERDFDEVYIDDIDITDKTFIMQFAMGGSTDLAKFRQESEKLVAGLSAGQATPEVA